MKTFTVKIVELLSSWDWVWRSWCKRCEACV